MKRANAIALLLSAAALAGATGVDALGADKAKKPAKSAAATPGPARQPKVGYQEFTLKNGLRVIISEFHHAPVFAISVTYVVGSRDEKPGRTGFAHLFEHMMFQGSENVGKAEHFVLISNYGGQMNGTTSYDRTNYFERLPANQLDLALFLESDRMRSLDVSQENLDNQRKAVQEERRLRYDNAPYGQVWEKLTDLSLDNFAYKHSTIGSMADLNAATLDDVRDFFKKYYAPNNAVLVLVGDVNTKEALAKVEKYFGNIPSQPAPVIPDESEKTDKGERRGTHNDPLAPMPRIDMLYPTIAGNHADVYALDLLGQVLGGGEGSRLYQKLVKETQLATSAAAGIYILRGTSPFIVQAMVSPGRSPEEVEKLINAELEQVRKEGVTAEELSRAKTALRSANVSTLESSVSTAVEMGQLTAYFGSPDLINSRPELYEKVTTADVLRVANTYLKTGNRGVLTTLPAKKEGDAAPGATGSRP